MVESRVSSLNRGRIWGFGSRVWGLGFSVGSSGCLSYGFMIHGLGC
jgi:hypothetical protein